MVNDQVSGKSVRKLDLRNKYLIVDVVLENKWFRLLRVVDRQLKFIHGPGEGLMDQWS
jgi:hypothetical protein